jgi:hypothetical protein
MNPALFQLCAEFPNGVLPEVFGVITAADPQELRGEDGLPGSILGDALRIKGWQHYPAVRELRRHRKSGQAGAFGP